MVSVLFIGCPDSYREAFSEDIETTSVTTWVHVPSGLSAPNLVVVGPLALRPLSVVRRVAQRFPNIRILQVTPAGKQENPAQQRRAVGETLCSVEGVASEPVSEVFRAIRQALGQEAETADARKEEAEAGARAQAEIKNLSHRLQTAREHAEEARRLSEERLRLALWATNDMIWDYDVAADSGLWLKTQERIFGSRPSEAPWSLETWLGQVHPDDRERLALSLREACESSGEHWGAEHRFVRSDGSYAFMLERAFISRDEAGQATRVLGAMLDLTERRRMEEALADQTRELLRSNAELEQFAYVASHDLQEPLRMVVSFAELLAERYRDSPDAKTEKYIGYIVGGARRMQQLVNDLLAFSRVGTQGGPLQPTDAEAALRQVLAAMQVTIEETGAEIRFESLPVVLADAVQLRQLFQNLLGNALKFRSESPPCVSVRAERRLNEWEFSVQDNGIGIAPEYAEQIFVMFQRLHTRAEYEGNGIGLAIAKKIVERAGGRIWCESQPGEGATFCFTLPAAPERTA